MAMDQKEQIRTSKFLSLVLRHDPEAANVTLDEGGWCSVDNLLLGCKKHGYPVSLEDLRLLVAESDKKRFQFSDDGASIRAVQGHSVEIELGYVPQHPPETLYHGTAARFLDSIRTLGLLKQSRQFVHLSPSAELAQKVGRRHGKPIVLEISSGIMHRAGIVFFMAPNGVWLVDAVPASYLRFPQA